ncbi:hypothetical protein AAFF_G00373920, partial [Aldrovandia affinis]
NEGIQGCLRQREKEGGGREGLRAVQVPPHQDAAGRAEAAAGLAGGAGRGVGLPLVRRGLAARELRPRLPGGPRAHLPLRQPLRADAQEPDGEEPEAAAPAPGARGQPGRGGALRLLPLHVRAALRVPPVRGGVQAQPRRHLDHEARRALAGPRHLPVPPAQGRDRLAAGARPGGRAARRGGARGELRGPAVHRGPLPDQRPEVRPARLRAGDVVPAAEGLAVPRRLRPLLRDALLARQHPRPVRPPDQRGVAAAAAAPVPDGAPRRPGGGGAVRRDRQRLRPQPAERPEGHHQRQALLRALRLRHHPGQGPEAVADRGERLALAQRHLPAGLRAQVPAAGGHAERGGHGGPADGPRGAGGRVRPHVERRARVPRGREPARLRQPLPHAQHAPGLLQ